jgi:CRP-like cAMP-binding protein
MLRKKIEGYIPVDDASWDQMCKIGRTFQVRRRQVFSAPGEIFDRMLYLEKGIARCYLIQDGEEKTIYFFTEGNFTVDFRSYITDAPSALFFEAIEDCSFFSLPKKELMAIYAAQPEFFQFDLAMTRQEFLRLSERMIQFYQDDLETRYLNLLNAQPELFQRIPQHYIASYLGVKPQSLSRIKNRALGRNG